MAVNNTGKPGMIEWIPEKEGGKIVSLDAQNMTVKTVGGNIKADVINIVPPCARVWLRRKKSIADKLVRKGDKSRLITPCASCHGLFAQGGKEVSPALAGLSKKAFIRAMQLYKNGQRHNDVNQVMSQFAKKLTDEEIEQLADYYQ